MILTGLRLCGMRLIAIGKFLPAHSVNSFNKPADTNFSIRRFVEESTNLQFNPLAPNQAVTDSIASIGEISGRDTLTMPRKQLPYSNRSLEEEVQHAIVSENRPLSRCLAQVYRELAENRILLKEMRMVIKPKVPKYERPIIASYTELANLKDSMDPDFENNCNEDLNSSESDIFFDCISRLSLEDSVSLLNESQGVICASPGGCFERSPSFYPEQYTVDGLFSNPLFVFSMKPSEEDYRKQNYFLVYAETPRRWRRITISATFHGVQKQSAILATRDLDNAEAGYKMLPRIVRNQFDTLIPRLELYESITNISFSFEQNQSGQIVSISTGTKISEDLAEVRMSGEDQILYDLEDLGCAQFLESEIIVQSRMLSSYFIVRVESRTCIERKAPFVNAGEQGENGFRNYFDDLKLLKSMRGCNGVAEFIGIVLDDTRSHLRSYLLEYPILGNVMKILIGAQLKSETLPWDIRESWARQIIQTVSEIHSRGSLVGGLLWMEEIGIRANGTVVLTGLRTYPRHFENRSGKMAPELRDISHINGRTLGKMVTFRTEIFQLGLILWKLAEHKDNTAGCFCSKAACTNHPRYLCDADHANPVELPTCNPDIPSYFGDIINQCRLPDPKMRPTACELAEILPYREADQSATAKSIDLLKRYACAHTLTIYCSECGSRNMNVHYHCDICTEKDIDLCQVCFAQGFHCSDQQHRLTKRIYKDDGTSEESSE